MSAKIILTSQPGSAKFSDRVLLLGQEAGMVSRSSREKKSDTYNAVFECLVLSKSHAAFSFQDGKFYLKDTGSCNGTFLNNLRLSRAGEESEMTQVYSQDIIRFGSQVDITKSEKAKCIIAGIRLYLNNGTEFGERDIMDKFFRTKADINAWGRTEEEEIVEDKLAQLEKIITEVLGKDQNILKETIGKLEKRLERKQSENENLLENIAKISEDEINRVAEIYYLKEALRCKNNECEQLTDKLETMETEQIEKENVDTHRDLTHTLACATDKIGLLTTKLRCEEEANLIRENQIHELSISLQKLSEEGAEKVHTHSQMKAMLKNCWTNLEYQKVEIKQLNDLVTKADQIMEEKDEKITELTNQAVKNTENIKLKDGEYINLKLLVDEENEAVDQIQTEMKQLLGIITDDQQIIIQKEQTIIELKNCIQDNGEHITQSNEENSNLKNIIKHITNENATKENVLKSEIDSLKMIINEKEEEKQGIKVSLEKQQEVFLTYDSLKDKIEESMRIVEQKSRDLEDIQKEVKTPVNINQRFVELEKENSELKLKVFQKETDIENLEELIEQKNNISVENYQLMEKIKKVNEEKYHQLRELENDTTEKDKTISEQKGVIENTRRDIEEMNNSKTMKTKARQIQESELMKKDRKISILKTILTQERRILLEKEEELEIIRKDPNKRNGLLIESPPSRPPRNKPLPLTADIPEKANISRLTELDDDYSNSGTFHDALNNDLSVSLSDQEGAMIQDLEFDEEPET